MHSPSESRAVVCVGCRTSYLPEEAANAGCPHCGCLSWFSAKLAPPPAPEAPPLPA